MNLKTKPHDPDSVIELLFENDQRFANVLFWIVIATIIGFGVGILASLAEGEKYATIALATGIVFLVLTLRLIRKKRIIPAGFVVSIISLGLLTYLATVGYGIRDIVSMAFPSLLIITSLILKKRQFYVLIFLNIMAIGWVIFGAQLGCYTPLSVSPSSWEDFIMITAILLVTGYAARAIAGNMHASLLRARAELDERRELQTKLDRNQVFLRAIINDIPFDLWVCDSDGRYFIQNAISLKFAGDLTGKTVEQLDFASPEQKAVYKAKHQRVLQGETIREEIKETIHGEDYYFLSVQTPVEDNGKILGFVGMNIDLTDIRQAEKMLQESESKYRTVIENSHDVVYSLDKDKVINFVSPQVRQYGYQPEDVLGKNLFDFIFDADKEIVNTGLSPFDDISKRPPMQFRIIDSAGNLHWTEVIANTQFDTDHNFVSETGILHDISARKQMELERETLIAELQAKNEELEKFTYTVSHDLKAPLFTISGFLGYLTESAVKGDFEQLDKDIQRITGATKKMQRLLDELLELSRVGRMMQPAQDIPFGEIVQESLENVKGQLNESNIEVRVGSDFPIVRGDRTRLVQVVQNLVDNAVKFMGDQKKPEIQIDVKYENGQAIFYVKDNGVGIEPENLEKIFGLFNKLDADTSGTGIGLALVERIINVHNGKIWVQSGGIGYGTTFFFILPVKSS